jgi:lipopolysaccharide export system permease protein
MIGATITRYFALRFMRTILAIFFTIFCLMFVVVFVEMLRRASDNPQAGAATVAPMTAMWFQGRRDDPAFRRSLRIDGDLR